MEHDMTKVFIPPGQRELYVSDAGDDANDGESLMFPFLTLATASAAATALVPTAQDRVAILDPGNSTYLENFVIPDETIVEMATVTLKPPGPVGVSAGGGNTTALSQIRVDADGATAYSTNGNSRATLFIDSIILAGNNQVGVLTSGSGSFNFVNLVSMTAAGTGCIGINHTTSQPNHEYFINNLFFLFAGCTAMRFDTSSITMVGVQVGTITMQDPDAIAIEVVAGTIAVQANDIQGDVIVRNGATLDLTVGVILGDIIVDTGGTLNLQVTSHTGTITNNGAINGPIYEASLVKTEHFGDIDFLKTVNYGSSPSVIQDIEDNVYRTSETGHIDTSQFFAQNDHSSDLPAAFLSMDVAPDLTKYFIAGNDPQILRYDMATPGDITTIGAVITSTFNAGFSIQALNVSPDGRDVITIAGGVTVRFWTMATPFDFDNAVQGADVNPSEPSFILSSTASADGRFLYLHDLGMIYQYSRAGWDDQTLTFVGSFATGSANNVQCSTISSDGAILYVNPSLNDLQEYALTTRWDITTAVLIRTDFDFFENTLTREIVVASTAGQLFSGGTDLGGEVSQYNLGLSASTFVGDLKGTVNSDTTGVTQTDGDNSTKVATTAYVEAHVSGQGLWSRSGTILIPVNAGDTVRVNSNASDNTLLGTGVGGGAGIENTPVGFEALNGATGDSNTSLGAFSGGNVGAGSRNLLLCSNSALPTA